MAGVYTNWTEVKGVKEKKEKKKVKHSDPSGCSKRNPFENPIDPID